MTFDGVSDVAMYLGRYRDSDNFRGIVQSAIALLESKQAADADVRAAGGQRSVDVADLYAFRLDSGYYKKGHVLGIEESIASLQRSPNIMATLYYVSVGQALIAMWIDAHGALAALMIFSG